MSTSRGGYGPSGPGNGGYGPPPGGGGYGSPPDGPGQYGPGGPGGPGQYGPGGPGQYGPGGPDGPGQYGPGGYGQGEPSYQPQPARRRGAKALIIALVVAVLLGGGAFAAYKFDPFNAFSSEPAAAEAIPADAVFYFGVDLDPSAEQKVKAVQFLNHFPAFKDEVDVSDPNADIRKAIFDKSLEESTCDVTYDDDIEPWLGTKFAGAAMPPGDSDSGSSPDRFVFVLEVTDETLAEEGIKTLAACDDAEAEFGVAFTGDYALVADTQDLADEYAADVEQGSLADDSEFNADLDSLGGVGFATLWVDVESAVKLYGSPQLASDDLDFLLSSYQRAAATVRFESDSVEVVTSVFGDRQKVEHGDNKIVDLPDSTAFAVSEAGGEQRLNETYDSLVQAAEKSGVDVEAQIADFESQTGLSIPEDIATVLGENIMFAVDADGLNAEALQSEDPSQINAGVRFTNDPDELNAIYDKMLALVQEETGRELPVSKRDLDDGLVVATNDDYVDKLSEDGSLGDTDAFTSVTDDAADKEFVLFFDFDSIEDQIIEAMESDGMPPEVIDNVRPIQAFGVTFGVEGDYLLSTFRMSVND